MSQKIKTYGFTLIELLVVIAIIGVLASIVLVSLGGARAKASASKAKSDLSQIMTALELYQSDNVNVAGIGVGTCANAAANDGAEAVAFGGATASTTTQHFAVGNAVADDLCYGNSLTSSPSAWVPAPAVPDTTYLQTLPAPPATYTYELSAIGTATTYGIRAVGFSDTGSFTCTNGSCSCSGAALCQK